MGKKRGMDTFNTANRRMFGLGSLGFLDDDMPDLLSNYYGPTVDSVGWSLPSLTEIMNAAKTAAGVYLSYTQAQQIQDINLQRVRAGQPILTPYQMSQLSPQVNVGVSPQMQQMLMIGGAGLLAVFLLSRTGKRA